MFMYDNLQSTISALIFIFTTFEFEALAVKLLQRIKHTPPSAAKMVLIHLKSALTPDNNDEFLFEALTSENNADLISSLVKIHNARVVINFCCENISLYAFI